MSKYLNNAKLLQRRISDILLKEWDPIGIQNIPEAQDEYDTYIVSIYRLLISKKSEHEIFDYLWWVETVHMGLSGDKQRTKTVANKLKTLVDFEE